MAHPDQKTQLLRLGACCGFAGAYGMGVWVPASWKKIRLKE